MEKIKNKVIDTAEWMAAITLTTGILFAIVVAPAILELALDTILWSK